LRGDRRGAGLWPGHGGLAVEPRAAGAGEDPLSRRGGAVIFAGHPTRWLAPYAEGLLPTAQASTVAGHVLGCQRCRRTLAKVRAWAAAASRAHIAWAISP